MLGQRQKHAGGVLNRAGASQAATPRVAFVAKQFAGGDAGDVGITTHCGPLCAPDRPAGIAASRKDLSLTAARGLTTLKLRAA